MSSEPPPALLRVLRYLGLAARPPQPGTAGLEAEVADLRRRVEDLERRLG